MNEESLLIEKLRKIEALYARPGTQGERVAALNARERILERLKEFEKTEKAIEYRVSLSDGWSKSLFLALLRRYDLKPFRYPRQRRTTVMVRVTKAFVDEVLWPEYLELNKTLQQHLKEVTTRVISQAIHGDSNDATEEEPMGTIDYDP